jgi:hypothetical protein
MIAVVATGTSPMTHAKRRYQRLFSAFRHPVHGIEHEAEHLHAIEREGESGETPFIALLGLILFLLPIVIVFLAIAFGAYYLAR